MKFTWPVETILTWTAKWGPARAALTGAYACGGHFILRATGISDDEVSVVKTFGTEACVI
ncbi:MAG: hypothetical protein RB191_19390 [Terriglobia bacterium]|nr:hypothetical protein [Terriglobia bacterium]